MEFLIYLSKSIGILTLFYLVYFFVLRKDTFFTANRHFLLSGIVAAVLLPLLQFTHVTYIEAPTQTYFPIDETAEFNEHITPAPIAETFRIEWSQVFLFIYLLGCFILLVKLCTQLFSLLKLLRKYPANKIGKNKYVEVSENISPFSFFNYIVYNPSLHSDEEIAMIVAHENIHSSQWHTIDILLANAIRILQWGNPLSWTYQKRVEENLEFMADDLTVQQIPSKKAYQLALVKASSPLFAPELTVPFYQSFIKKRIIMLNKSNSNKYNQLKLSLIIPFLALFLWSFNVTEVTKFKPADTPAADSEGSTINHFVNEESYPSEPATLPGTEKIITKPASEEIIKNPSVAKATTKALANQVNALPQQQNQTTTLKVNRPKATKKRFSAKDFEATITKNTTDAELEKLKSDLKSSHNITLYYDVKRNAAGEITSLKFTYSGGGNNGSYHVNEDGPIADFFFYIDDNGDTGFYSGTPKRTHERMMRQNASIMEKRTEKMAQRVAKMAERVDNRREQNEDRLIELAERREELASRRGEMAKRMQDAREAHEEIEKHEIHEDHEELEEHIERELAVVKDYKRAARHEARKHKRDQRLAYTHSKSSHSIIIDKNTSDATLDKMKSNLSAKGITFSYSKLKRNANGEITRLKVEVDNGKGSKQTIFTKTDDGEPIEDMLIEL